MHRLVEILPGKISKMYGQGVGLRLEFIDQSHKRRFSISLETRRYGRDVHKIVGLVDYQFRHTDFAVIAHAHEVELHTASEQQRQIRPVATAFACQIDVLLSVAHGQRQAAAFFRDVDIFVVPCVDNAPQVAAVKLAPCPWLVVDGQFTPQRLRNRLAKQRLNKHRRRLHIAAD